MLRMWLFGSLSIALGADDAEVVAVSGRSASLLAYLALGRGRYFSRSELISAIWSEGASSGTGGSFNTALWRLRCLVERPPLRHGDLIVSDRRGAIGLGGPKGIWLDVDEFERLIAPGLATAIDHLSEADIDGLKRGAALYKSDILMDFTDQWALREREKHRRNYLNCLGRLMRLATIRREYAEGIRYGQAILDGDALREDVHRELMRLFVANGQRAQALQQFEHCRNLLRQELAIQPMRETLAVYQEIAQSAIGIPAASARIDLAISRDSSVPTESRIHSLVSAARVNLAAADAQLQLTQQIIDK